MKKTMHNRIDTMFEGLRSRGHKGLIVFLTAGYPDLKTTGRLIDILVQEGVDAIEIGIPFSDPMADGPTIQYSSQKALEQGVTLEKIISWLKGVRARTDIPLLCMGYCNPFYRYGITTFVRKIHGTIDGLIIPDLSMEESLTLRADLLEQGMRLVYLVTPLTPEKRLNKLMKLGNGFLYAVSTIGVTGARKDVAPETLRFLRKVQAGTDLPVAAGIGISVPKQVRKIKPVCDSIIVGSAYIKLIRQYRGQTLYRKIRGLTRALKKALNGNL